MASRRSILMFYLGILCVIALPLSYSANTINTAFSDGTSSGNISLIDGLPIRYYIPVPRYFYPETFRIDLYVKEPCFQETANATSACGGRDTGTYYAACYDGNVYATCPANQTNGYGNAFDGDYSTYAERHGNDTILQVWINYTKPQYSTGAIWNVLTDGKTANVTIPSGCWIASTDKIGLMIYTTNANQCQYGCYDATSPIYYFEGAYSCVSIYEDSVFWNYTTDVSINISDAKTYTSLSLYNGTLINTSTIRQFIADKCNCSGCSISNTNCLIPFSINSSKNSSVSYKNILLNNSFGVDNCSNSFGIASNATALNISFKDYNSIPSFVNLSSYILYGLGTPSIVFANTLKQISNITFCVYPAWTNLSYSSTFQYQDAAGNNYINSPSGFLNSDLQSLTYYVSGGATSASTTFTLKNSQNRQQLITNGHCISYIFLNGAYTLSEDKYTDITGNIIFNYVTNSQYQFICSAPNYETYTFVLNPISSSAYDIFLTPSTPVTSIWTFDRIGLTITPQVFYDGANTFNLTITSFYNEFSSYSFTLTYPGGTTTGSGTNSAGQSFNEIFTITGPSLYDSVQLDLYFTMPTFGTKSLTYYYPIYVNNTNTLINPPDPHYGLGLIERLLIVVFGMVLIIGLCYLVGQELPGMFLGFLWSGYWVYVGFVPLWAFLPSIFAGMIIIGSRSQ